MGYPACCGGALLDGSLKLRYHNFPFARKTPTWRLPKGRNVPGIIASFEVDAPLGGVHGVLGSDGRSFVRQSFKRVRLTKKTPCPAVYRVSARPIPDVWDHDPLGDGSPGPGRVVSGRLHGGFQSRKQDGSGRNWLNSEMG